MSDTERGSFVHLTDKQVALALAEVERLRAIEQRLHDELPQPPAGGYAKDDYAKGRQDLAIKALYG